jgi:hypothetical protein
MLTALNGHVSQLPPLRMVLRPISSSSWSVVCGQLERAQPVRRKKVEAASRHLLEERDITAVTLAERTVHAGVALPEEGVVSLSLDDSLASRDRNVQELVFAEVRCDPVCGDLEGVAVVRGHLSKNISTAPFRSREAVGHSR